LFQNFIFFFFFEKSGSVRFVGYFIRLCLFSPQTRIDYFWTKIKIFDKNRNFVGQNSKFWKKKCWSKIEIFDKNRNFVGQNSKFSKKKCWSKIEIVHNSFSK